jgi:hypothetical protein
MTTRHMTTRRLLLNLSLLLFMACKPNCDPEPPTLTCDTVALSLTPGECVEISNPCGDHQWVRLDAFRLCQPPAGIFVQTQRDPRKRFLCADSSVQPLVDEQVHYDYIQPNETGFGEFRITIGSSALEAVASANPTAITAGGSSQLNATVSGGTPPFAYAWTPSGGLSDPTIASPVASPSVTTQYTVLVTDSAGAATNDSVIVNVGSNLQACLTLTSLGLPTVQADASCSTGSIVQYRWWSSFRDMGEPPDATTTEPFRTLLYEIPGQYTVRLEVVDAAGATSATTQTITLP